MAEIQEARGSVRQHFANYAPKVVCLEGSSNEEIPVHRLMDRECDVAFRISSDDGSFNVEDYGKKETIVTEGPRARATIHLLIAELARRQLTHENGSLVQPRYWRYKKVLVFSKRGFAWTDPEPVDKVYEPRSLTFRSEREGVRGVNFIISNPDSFRKSKQVCDRLTLDALQAKTQADRMRDSFYHECALAVMSTKPNPEIDTLGFNSIHFAGLNPSIPAGGCCNNLDVDVVAQKLKKLFRSLTATVSQALVNMSQSGEGDRFADTITDASDGRCSFPDLDLSNGASSNPYDFLQSPLQCYWYAMLAREGLLNCATTTLSPTARRGSSSGSCVSTPREKKGGGREESMMKVLTWSL